MKFSPPPPHPFIFETQSHFDDLDAQWILHHSRQIRYVERAQQAWFNKIMQLDVFDPWKFPDLNVVVRRLEVDYVLPLKGVRPFVIALWPVRLRACGLTTQFEFRAAENGEVYTRGIREVCKISMKNMQDPELWTDPFASAVERELQAIQS